MDAVILDHIGQAFYQVGDKDKAVEYLERAVELEPGNEEYTTRLKEFRDGTAKRLTPESSESAPAATPAKPAGETTPPAPSNAPPAPGAGAPEAAPAPGAAKAE